MTAIAVPIFVKAGIDLEAAIQDAEEALEGTQGIIELRADTASEKQLLEAIDLARLPVIVTVRPTWEGGFSTKSDTERLALWEAAIEAGAEYIDVELAALEKSAKIRDAIEEATEKAGTRLILSNHSFEGRPADLEKRVERLRAVKPASILKIAWKAGSILDAVDALRLCSHLPITNRPLPQDSRPVVALAMGEEGVISRLLAKKFGAPFTFASVAAGKESAPGQVTVAELRGRYRWQRQRADTPVFGVVGWPVGHSLSPHIHNAGFDAANVEGVYVPLAVRETYEDFTAALDALHTTCDLHGVSVTIPHKENAFRYAREKNAGIDPLSARLGVINTLVWDAHGKITALNSDYAGALDALVSAWTGRREDVAGKRIAVLGAGGAARAIVAALVEHGATVVIYNRTRAKADALAAEFSSGGGVAESRKPTGKAVAADWEKLCDSCCEAYINCTPVGMHPKVNENPIDFDPNWTGETVIFDTVYNPPKTRLLKLAEKKGSNVVSGIEMFLRQALVQFKAFTGKNADAAVFRAAMKT